MTLFLSLYCLPAWSWWLIYFCSLKAKKIMKCPTNLWSIFLFIILLMPWWFAMRQLGRTKRKKKTHILYNADLLHLDISIRESFNWRRIYTPPSNHHADCCNSQSKLVAKEIMGLNYPIQLEEVSWWSIPWVKHSTTRHTVPLDKSIQTVFDWEQLFAVHQVI